MLRFVYQEDIGLKQSVDHDQEVCNNMLNVTAVLCVCVRAYGRELASHYPPVYVLTRRTQKHTHPPTHMHTHQEKMMCSAVSLVRFASPVETWSRVYFCGSAEFRAARGWTFLQLLSLCFKFSTIPRLKTFSFIYRLFFLNPHIS